MRGALGAGALALSLFATSGEAKAADITKSQCVDANTNGQTLRKEGKLTASRAQFQTCNDPKCPEIVRADCTQRLEEIEAAFPSIVFDTKKADGSDLVDVKVTMDGKVVAEKMDGTPLSADPGSHEFTFETPGEKPLTRTFVLKEGEKLRRERVQIGEAPPEKPVEPAKPPPPPPPKNGGTGDLLRIGGLGLAGAGIVALGVGVFYGLKASSKWSDQQDHCKSATDCSNHPQAISDHDGAVVYGRFATEGIIAGAVLLAGGVVMYLVAPPKNGNTDTKSGRLSDPFKFSF